MRDVRCAQDEISRLRAINAELLAALSELLEASFIHPDDLEFIEFDTIREGARSKARAAIAKAKGE